jgi:hypothetical protein
VLALFTHSHKVNFTCPRSSPRQRGFTV